MKLSGLQKLTLLDYPGHLAAILFLPGCNFRCPFCQNSSLVLSPDTAPTLSEDEFFRFLKKRSGILEGVCVTGGEPTLHHDLPDLLRNIKTEGYLVKLDTNGTHPDMLESLIQDGLVDYIAMDIKAGRNNYHRVCGLPVPSSDISCHNHDSADVLTGISSCARSESSSSVPHSAPDLLLNKINRSVELLLSSGIDCEFRTTVVNDLHTEADFEDIADWIAGCRAYYLQAFRDCPEILQQNHDFSAFSAEEMQSFLEIVQKKIPAAALRGI